MKLTHWEPDLRTISSRIKDGEIDLQPNFQRGDVWPLPKKRKLIDTILRGWSIPPIHVVETSSGTLEVLDGQQRLTAIRDFMRDDFAVDGTVEPFDNHINQLDGVRYSALSPSVRRSFDLYTLRVFRITDFKPEEPGELFYRLNQPLSLTAGEQRNALYGPARAQLKELVSNFQNADNTKETIGFSNARMSYDDVFSKLLFFLERGTFAIKATESAISDRFKLKRAFDDHVFERAFVASEYFSAARRQTIAVKLNKASLLSWLLYFVRQESTQLRTSFLPRFEEARERMAYKSRHSSNVEPWRDQEDLVGDAFVRLFIDRSSLRVSDVSSVVYRDFALWVISHLNRFEVPSAIKKNPDFDAFGLSSGVSRITNLEEVLDKHLNLQRWATF